MNSVSFRRSYLSKYLNRNKKNIHECLDKNISDKEKIQVQRPCAGILVKRVEHIVDVRDKKLEVKESCGAGRTRCVTPA